MAANLPGSNTFHTISSDLCALNHRASLAACSDLNLAVWAPGWNRETKVDICRLERVDVLVGSPIAAVDVTQAQPTPDIGCRFGAVS